uniref:Uncharacterized protein n=1 Tax=Arundo donax TaxID=35708 RepID=A0A0A9DZA6_ARUDO
MRICGITSAEFSINMKLGPRRMTLRIMYG